MIARVVTPSKVVVDLPSVPVFFSLKCLRHAFSMTASTTAICSLSTLYDNLPLPTGSQSVRVLDIRAGSGTEDAEQIQGRLRVVNLETHPPFSALSYVWGVDAQDPPIVKCGEFDIPVTANCYTALMHLRERLGDFSIWIDAVCINQADEGEKEQQIPLMGSIYSGAETVYVWLGESSPQSDKAMSYLANTGYQECFSRIGNPNEDGSPKSSSLVILHLLMASLRPFWSSYTSLGTATRYLGPVDGPNWVLRLLNFLRVRRLSRADYVTYDDLSDILERDWVRRLWTYQEILLASNPVVVCGDRYLKFSAFALGIVSLHHQISHDGIRQVFISSIKAWASIVVLRARLHDLYSNTLDESALWQSRHGQFATLQAYEKFLNHIYRIQKGYLSLFQFLFFVSIMTISIASFLFIPELIWAVIDAEEQDLIWFILIPIAASAFYLLLCVPQIPASHLTTFTSSLSEGKEPRATAQTYGLVDGVLSRKARDPRDKAFAVWAVLQRLLTTKLLAPDYSLPVGRIYKELSIHMIHATGSLDVLLAAAQSSFHAQPSWVPDWSQDDQNFWRTSPLVDPLPSGHLGKKIKRVEKIFNIIRDQVLEPPSHVHENILWRRDSEYSDTLSVQAYPFQTITSCYQFRKTSGIYLESEAAVHLRNLQTMLEFFRKRVVMQVEFHEHIFFLVDTFEGSLGKENKSFPLCKKQWYQFFFQACQSPPLEVLSVLNRSPSTRTRTLPFQSDRNYELDKVFQCQIRICNALAKLEKSLFITDGQTLWINGSRSAGQLSLAGGIGTQNVRTGDKILVIPRVSCPLVVRQEGHSTQLISPAFVYASNNPENLWPWNCPDGRLEEFHLS